jgi:hypothetical protein
MMTSMMTLLHHVNRISYLDSVKTKWLCEMQKKIVVIGFFCTLIGIVIAIYFSQKLDELGTYESINLLYMLIGEGMAGLGFIAFISGFFLLPNDSNLSR